MMNDMNVSFAAGALVGILLVILFALWKKRRGTEPRYDERQVVARAKAAQLLADARRQADELIAQAKERLAGQTQEILASAAARDAAEAEEARKNLGEAAARIIERIEQQ